MERDVRIVQGVLQGHTARMGLVEEEVEEGATVIQSVLHGYNAKQVHIAR